MRNIIKNTASFIMWVLSKLYPYQLNLRLKGYRNIVYTLWIKNFMGQVGDKTNFKYPLRLQGGGYKRIHIGSRTCFQAYCVIGCWEKHEQERFAPDIIVGDDCNIGEFCHISAVKKITIGNGLLTGRFVYIGDNSHGGLSWKEAAIPPGKRHLKSKGEIKIGNNVWIADKVTILGGVTIGDNVIIGAGSVVNNDVPSNCIVAGIPANIIKKLSLNNE